MQCVANILIASLMGICSVYVSLYMHACSCLQRLLMSPYGIERYPDRGVIVIEYFTPEMLHPLKWFMQELCTSKQMEVHT